MNRATISSSLSSKSRSASAPPAKQARAPPGLRMPRRRAAAWLKTAWKESSGVETARKSSHCCGPLLVGEEAHHDVPAVVDGLEGRPVRRGKAGHDLHGDVCGYGDDRLAGVDPGGSVRVLVVDDDAVVGPLDGVDGEAEADPVAEVGGEDVGEGLVSALGEGQVVDLLGIGEQDAHREDELASRRSPPARSPSTDPTRSGPCRGRARTSRREGRSRRAGRPAWPGRAWPTGSRGSSRGRGRWRGCGCRRRRGPGGRARSSSTGTSVRAGSRCRPACPRGRARRTCPRGSRAGPGGGGARRSGDRCPR